MIIANPLYDVVFKYLLEDIDIARELLATIMGEKILFLEVKPQETVTEVSPDGSIRIIRFDFKATIESPNGEQKKVLIELQKLKQSYDVMRFRRYLGDNYSKEDDVILGDGTLVKMPLPIVTIYILGFDLVNLLNSVVKINREYKDMLTGETIKGIKEEFVELLTHDSFIIQARRLPPSTKTKLERVLQIFNPKFKTTDRHKLDFTGDTDEPIVQKMVNRLQRAIVSEEVRRNMDVEDEVYRILERESKKAAAEAAAETAAEKDIIIAEKDQVIVEQEQALVEKDQALVEKEQEIELLMQQLAALQKKNQK
jgi:hypothetical protein